MKNNNRQKGGFFHNITNSIFTKLLLIFLISGIIIYFLLGFFFRAQILNSRKVPFYNNIKLYSDYIIKSIGFPPDFKEAMEISEKAGLIIEMQGKNISWISDKIDLNKRYFRHLIQVDDDGVGWYRGRAVFVTEQNGLKYTFITKSIINEGAENSFFYLLIAVSLVLILTYLMIRKTLKPVKYLSRGVKETANGNFSFQIPVIKKDELGRLSESFNEMNSRIRSMIEAKHQLLLDVSHELRSPLTRIKVALELIEDSNERRSIAEDINNLEHMIAEILESESLNSKRGLNKEEIKVSSFIKDIIKDYSPDYLINYFDEECREAVINADRDRLHTVFRNILDNALKYSGVSDKPLEIRCCSKDNFFIITIRDYGVGIPEKDLPYVFEPFYRVDHSRSRETGGYGIGLALCKKIMEAHNAVISIENNSDSGVTVRLKFTI